MTVIGQMSIKWEEGVILLPHGWRYQPYDAEERAQRVVDELFDEHVYPALREMRETQKQPDAGSNPRAYALEDT